MNPRSIEACFAKPVIPVLWDVAANDQKIASASSVFLQGGSLSGLSATLDACQRPGLQHIHVFVHIDLVAGIENNESGVEFLATHPRVAGVVTVHHGLTRALKRAGLFSIVRLFLSDSRAVERGLSVVSKCQADAIEIMPAATALQTKQDFIRCPLPRIAGGLCRSENDVRQAICSGVRAVTSTRAELWALND